MTYDAIVVGSGPGGANAAAALVERGRTVLMLDVGARETPYDIPSVPFTDIRRTDATQRRFMLGDAFEGIPESGVRAGAQLTPPRRYVTADVASMLPTRSGSFTAVESLAFGGLGAAWGAGVFTFDDSELAEWPADARDALAIHYDAVAARIGISAGDDDLARFFPSTRHRMPVPIADPGAALLLERYAAMRGAMNRRGFYLGRPALAMATESFRGRGPQRYRDMDFWDDADRSVYRPQFTVEELSSSTRFTYAGGQLVLRFAEDDSGVTVTTRDVRSGETRQHRARTLLLGAGTLGSARIVLRSLDRYGDALQILCNPYTYVPVVNLRLLGRDPNGHRHSLAQLTAIHQPELGAGARGAVQVQYYSYRSLLNFRLLAEAPLPFREGIRIMRRLSPALGILGINHDDAPGSRKRLWLDRDERDGTLVIDYSQTPAEERRIDEAERSVMREFRRLGAWPIKRVRPGPGSSIHYAGTLPFRARPGDLETDPSGRLGATRAVYLVDGSSFPYLPAKGLTFTIMANANRVATGVAERLG